MSAIEIFKLVNEIMPVGKFSSGIVATFFISPIRPEFSWELLLFLYIIIGAVFGAILLFTNELLLKVLKIESSKKSSKMGLLDRMGFLEAFVFILVIIYLRGGVIMLISLEIVVFSCMLGIGVGTIGLMSGIISLFLMAPHTDYIRPRLLRWIVKLVYSSILLFLIGVLLSIAIFILIGVVGIVALFIQLLALVTLCVDLVGWYLLSLGVATLYREWIERSVELRLKLRETETEIETKTGTGLGIPKPDEIPPFVIDELRKDTKTINQRLEKLSIPAGAIKEVKLREGIPESLKHEIELVQAKIELTGEFYGLEKPVSYFMKFGNFYLESKDYEKAIEQYEKVLEKEPENADAWFNRGFARVEKGDYEKAIKDFDLYIEKIDPYDADAYNNRGSAYQGLNQYERAIEDYNKAIELNPEYGRAYTNRGVAYRKSKQYEKEQEDYKKALELDPNYIDAMLDFSESYILTKNYSGAHEMAERALNIAEESTDIIMSHFLMVCSSLFQNKKEDAKRQLIRLIDYLKKIKDWRLTWDFSDVAPVIESSDVDKNAKSLMLSLIELLENKITLGVFKNLFFAAQ